MELIERYIYAVTHRLPVDMQADVSDELRGNIEEALEKKGSQSKKAIREVLTELGDPALLAARYSGTSQYVISPQYYLMFIQVLKLVLGIGLPIVVAIAVIAQIAESPATIGSFIGGAIGILISAGVQMVFWTALVFFIIERCGISDKDLVKGSAWTSDMLPDTTEKREIPMSESIADIFWYIFVIAVPFVAHNLIGAHIDGAVTPFFNATVWNIGGPVLVAFGLVGIVKSVFKLKIGRWTKPLAIFNSLFALAFSGFFIAVIVTQSIVNPAFLDVVNEQITTSNLEEVTTATSWTVIVSVAIFAGIYMYDAINSLYCAYRKKM